MSKLLNMDEEEFYNLCVNVNDTRNVYPECYSVEKPKSKTLFVILLTLLIILCIIGNSLVCIAFCCYRRLRVITHYYIFSLAISDLLVGLITMPIWLNYELTGWSDNIDEITILNIMDFVDILTCVSSIVNLTCISIDRFFGIVKPLQHKTFVTEKTAILFICTAWIYSFIIAGLKMVPTFMNYFLFCFVTGYLVPVVVICGCYLFIFGTVKKHAKRRLSNQLSKERTLAKTIAIVITFFIVCWTPFFVVTLLYQYCAACTFLDKPWFEYLHSVIKALHYLNSSCNPFIYGVFNTNFRSAYKAILYRCLGLIFKDFNTNLYETSVVGRYSSVRQRSNTVNSVLSYTESMRSAVGSTSSDDLLSVNSEKFQRRFQRTESNNSIIRNLPNPLTPKPLTPTGLEEEPRFLLRQKFQKQLSTEQQYSPVYNTAESDKIFDQIMQAFSSTVTDENLARITNKLGSNFSSDDRPLLNNESFVKVIQNKTFVEIDTLFADARESNI